ncbi:MAG: ROK family protein, partial [Acidimicrobiia bacterium]|nr:ROK family protein [Acidimicrobiia bacterium]
PGWSNTDLAGTLGGALGVPVGIDTDVNGAALGEGRWGSAVGLTSFVYLTVGTGIGAGVLVDGRPLHGLVHPEIGHVAVNRHPDDGFAGLCPFHGDCFEGLASGPAISERWGDEPRQLAPALARSAAQMEAFYVAEGLRTIVFTLAPERIIVGGGVSQIDGFHQDVRSALMKTLAGYPGLSEHESEDFVVAPGLGDRSGIAGGFVLADLALAAS